MIVKLNGIYKNYEQGGKDVPVLKNINMDVAEGEYIAIMGPSGSGKTTLMNLLGCLDTPTKGSYRLDGQDVSGLSDPVLAEIRNKKIGFVFQGFNLLNEYDAIDNVALPLLYAGMKKEKRRQLSREALDMVGLSDRMSFKPGQLSGGQQQRVAIARAFVTRPKLLLADEPTGALDSESGNELMDVFDGLHEAGCTIVMITHERAIAERSHRILYIRDGQLTGGAIRRQSVEE